MDINNPHDKFFRDMFSRIEVVQDFCQHYLPREIVELLDLSTLTLEKSSFIDEKLREYFSDLLSRVQLRAGREIYICILIEHKSHPQQLVSLQLLRYMVEIRENDWNQSKGSGLHPIIPLVIYHGKRNWNIPPDFQSLFLWTEGMEKYLPQFEYLLFDIPRMKDEQISGNTLLKTALTVLKYILQQDVKKNFSKITTALQEPGEKRSDVEEIFHTVLIYLYQVISVEDHAQVKREFENALREGAEKMPTIAEYYIQQGIQKGVEQEARETILDNLTVRFTNVPKPLLETISILEDIALLRPASESPDS